MHLVAKQRFSDVDGFWSFADRFGRGWHFVKRLELRQDLLILLKPLEKILLSHTRVGTGIYAHWHLLILSA